MYRKYLNIQIFKYIRHTLIQALLKLRFQGRDHLIICRLFTKYKHGVSNVTLIRTCVGTRKEPDSRVWSVKYRSCKETMGIHIAQWRHLTSLLTKVLKSAKKMVRIPRYIEAVGYSVYTRPTVVPLNIPCISIFCDALC